jgi:hypothetical protein
MAINNNEPITGTPPDGTVEETEQKPPSPTGTTTTPTPTTQNKPTSGTDGQVVQQNTADTEHATMDDIIDTLKKERAKIDMPSEADLEKERKKQKREKIIAAVGDGISALSNLFFTTQGAPNMYNAQTGSMSTKLQERYDKIKKERDANAERYLNYSLKINQLQNDDRNWKHQLEREGISDQRYDDQQKYQHERDAVADKRYDDQQKHQAEREAVADSQWQKQFEEGKRQFNVTSSQNAARINMEAKRLAKEMQSGSMTFSLGSGNGNVTLSSQQLNASNVSLVYNKLPESLRQKIGNPIKDKITGAVIGYEAPTTEAMLIAIGANIDRSDCEDARKALQAVAGQKTSTGTMPGVGSSTMPGVK